MVRLPLLFVFTLVVSASCAVNAGAQVGSIKGAAAGASRQRGTHAASAEARDALIRAAREYKISLGELLALRERDAEKSSARLERMRRLHAGGVVSGRELETAESEAAQARAGVKEMNLQLVAADYFLAEALVEVDEREEIAGRKAAPPRGRAVKTAYVRSNGSGNWALSDVSQVENFFATKFGRPLPVTAFGQSDLHTRWGFDHRNSLDVGLHPDSPEGRALVEYLRDAGIPFIAFRSAVPGSATGPHIHVGRPSHRIRAQ